MCQISINNYVCVKLGTVICFYFFAACMQVT